MFSNMKCPVKTPLDLKFVQIKGAPEDIASDVTFNNIGIHLRANSPEMFETFIRKMCFKTTHLSLPLCLPGTKNEIVQQNGMMLFASVNEPTIGSNSGLWTVWWQTFIWTNAALLSIGPLGTNFCEIWTKIQIFSFKKTNFKMSYPKWWPLIVV